MQALDSTIRRLYEAASGLVNDGVETLRGYGLVQAALDIQWQSILRNYGTFIRPNTSQADPKPGPMDRPAFCARSLSTNAPKKKKSRGKGRKTLGLPPHPICPPLSPKPELTSLLGLAGIKSFGVALMHWYLCFIHPCNFLYLGLVTEGEREAGGPAGETMPGEDPY